MTNPITPEAAERLWADQGDWAYGDANAYFEPRDNCVEYIRMSSYDALARELAEVKAHRCKVIAENERLLIANMEGKEKYKELALDLKVRDKVLQDERYTHKQLLRGCLLEGQENFSKGYEKGYQAGRMRYSPK